MNYKATNTLSVLDGAFAKAKVEKLKWLVISPLGIFTCFTACLLSHLCVVPCGCTCWGQLTTLYLLVLAEVNSQW